jgi:hypothetical protein
MVTVVPWLQIFTCGMPVHWMECQESIEKWRSRMLRRWCQFPQWKTSWQKARVVHHAQPVPKELSTTTICSETLIYLLDLGEVMEDVMGGLVNCWLPSGRSPGSEGKWWGSIQLASSLNLPLRS